MSSPLARRPALPALTGIRFFAAMAVFFFHFGAALLMRLGAPQPLIQLLKNGYLGVSVFFVLSGFIMTYTYEGHLRSGAELRDYAWARFARLYPVYVLALILSLPVLEKPLDAVSAVKVLFMVQSWTAPSSSSGFTWVTQAWTLSVELFFYLMFPLLLNATRGWRNPAILASLTLLATIIIAAGIPTITPGYKGPISFVTHWPLPVLRIAEFALGFMSCKWLLLNPEAGRQVGRAVWTYCTAAAILFLLSTQNGAHVMGCITVLFAILFPQLAGGDGKLTAFLSSPQLVLLGRASYALYLLQGPVHSWAHWLIPEAWVRAVQFVVTMASAIAVFRYFEEPARRLLRMRLARS